MNEARVSGVVVRDQIVVYARKLGEEAVKRALSRLPPDEHRELEELLPISWIRCSTWVKAVSELAVEAGRPVMELDAEIVNDGLEHTFGTVWKVLLRFTTDEALMKRTSQLWRKTFDKGTMTANFPGKNRAELTLTGFPEVHDLDVQGTAIAIKKVLELGGRKAVNVRHRRTSDGVIFEANWTG
jgi:hypothetical protein